MQTLYELGAPIFKCNTSDSLKVRALLTELPRYVNKLSTTQVIHTFQIADTFQMAMYLLRQISYGKN